MTALNNIIKRAMSLMKAHVQYSQSLAVQFADLIKDYEDLVEAPEVIELDAQEEFDLAAVCAVFEELMENEPIAVLRALRPYGVEEYAEEDLISNNSVEELHLFDSEEEAGIRRSRIIRFKCAFCGKSFRHKGDLDRHVSVHTQEMPFVCTICGKRFGYKYRLVQHARDHSRQKKFECSICKKKFDLKRNLMSHTRIHTAEKTLECLFCNKRFRHKFSLKLHARIHKN